MCTYKALVTLQFWFQSSFNFALSLLLLTALPSLALKLPVRPPLGNTRLVLSFYINVSLSPEMESTSRQACKLLRLEHPRS